MNSKSQTNIGLEFDATGIRAARVEHHASDGKNGFAISRLEEIRGDYAKDDSLAAGLKAMREKIGINGSVQVATCVSGKQVYAAQIPFRKLKPEEMGNALRLEIRKNLPFEAGSATIEYQVVDAGDQKQEEQQLLVSAVANILLSRQLQVMAKAGIKPSIVDTLPTVVSNAFYMAIPEPVDKTANVILHFGPAICTLVMEGKGVPFFHRNIYFSADELYNEQQTHETPERERQRRLAALADEIIRSISFYEKTYPGTQVMGYYLLGDFTDNAELTEAITDKTGLQPILVDICSRLKVENISQPAKFSAAIALGMRKE